MTEKIAKERRDYPEILKKEGQSNNRNKSGENIYRNKGNERIARGLKSEGVKIQTCKKGRGGYLEL